MKASTIANTVAIEKVPLKAKEVKKLKENWISINHKMIVVGRGIFIRSEQVF